MEGLNPYSFLIIYIFDVVLAYFWLVKGNKSWTLKLFLAFTIVNIFLYSIINTVDVMLLSESYSLFKPVDVWWALQEGFFGFKILIGGQFIIGIFILFFCIPFLIPLLAYFTNIALFYNKTVGKNSKY